MPNRVIRQTPGDALRALVLVNGAGRKRIVAGHTILRHGHVSLGRIGLLVRPCVLMQPGVERSITAIKLGDVVLAAQLLYFELGLGGPAHDRRLATCGSLNKRRSRGLPLGGRSRAAMNALHCLSSSTNRVWSDRACSAFSHALRMMKSDRACSAFSHALRMMKSVTFTPWPSAATLMRISSEAVARSWNRRSRG